MIRGREPLAWLTEGSIAMRIAYVVNQYPKPSHTFIRREMAALEALGFHVERYSLRQAREGVTDPADGRELERTRVVLAQGPLSLVAFVVAVALKAPWRFTRSLSRAVSLGWGSDRGVLRHLAYLVEAATVAWWIRESRCDHLHSHFGTNSTTVAMLASMLTGVPFSFTVHGPEEFDKPLTLALPRKIAAASFVAAVSSFGRSQVYRHCEPAEWGKVHVVRCGVDAAYAHGGSSVAVPSRPRLVCVGRLCEQKGQLLLLEAAKRLNRAGKAFELVLVGDGEMRDEVERRVDGSGLRDRVRITGWASEAVVRKEILDARALVLPSFAEGLPVVLMEALALGRPVISTYVAGIPELVVPGHNGWLVPAGCVDALVGAMAEALGATPERLAAMGGLGARRVGAQHDVGHNARHLARLFAQGAWRDARRPLGASEPRPAPARSQR